MSKFINFVGFWKILDCIPVANSINTDVIQESVFQLSQTGNATWKIPHEAMFTPLFNCNTYEVVGSYSSNYLIRFGSCKGHVIDCTVKAGEPYSDTITINDGWCQLVCTKFDELNYYEDLIELPFSFLQALQDSYFSDLILKASNDKKFSVHTCILKLGAPGIDWSSKNNPLSKLPEDIVSAILHFVYAQCLPEGLDENAISKILSAASEISGLEALVSLCQLYFRNVTLKKKIFSLISDMHMCASHLIEYFTNKQSSNQPDSLTSDPAKLCFAVKSSIREAAVAASKLLVICDLYEKQKNELSKEDEYEMIFYVKTRIPIFMNQLDTFFKLVKSTFSNLLTSQRQELACYLVQEIETIFDTVTSILSKMKTVLEVMLAEFEKKKTSNQKSSEGLEHYTDVLHRKEVNRLRGVIGKITSILVYSNHKKESIRVMNNGDKIRSVAKDLEQFIGEDLPIFALWMEKFTSALEERLKWDESVICFNIGISKVNEVIKKLVAHKESLQAVLFHLCNLVQRDSFAKTLAVLGLLDASLKPDLDPGEINREESSANKTNTYQMPKLSTKNSFCVSPPAHRNRLSEAAGEMLKSERETDMVFEIINAGDSDDAIDPDGDVSVESQTPSSPRPKCCVMAAHRVIVSARCDWFRRALLSGMQESITRKIQVYDTTPHVFSLLLKYLYSGQLDLMSLSVDHLSELLLLSDRYEVDSLKQLCECGLTLNLDVDSVIYCFSIADRINADLLKTACEQFIAEHIEVFDLEVFEELPDNLQTEIYDFVMYGKVQTTDLSPDEILSSTSCNIEEVEEMIADFHINRGTPSPNADGLPPAQNSSRLEEALRRLREVVGGEIPRSQLVRVILAADYDVNRAINFYYSSN